MTATRTRGGVPDFIYWMIFVILTALHYYTKTQGTPEHGMVEFFVIVWLASFIGLVALKLWAPEPRREVVDYDENLERWHLDYVVVGLLGVELVGIAFSALASGAAQVTAMWVPQMALQFYDDILFNFGLVATAEESSKILTIKALAMKLGGMEAGRAFSVVGPVAFWALLHGYQSYVGYGEAVMWLMIASAFISGLIMYYAVKKTRNIVTAFLIHGAYNALVVLTQAVF